MNRCRHGLAPPVVGDCGANLVHALARALPREQCGSRGRLAKLHPVGSLEQFTLVQNMRDRAVSVGGGERDLDVTRRTEKAAVLRRDDGHRRRLVVAEELYRDRLVIVHDQRDRLLRPGDVALPLVEAQPLARLGREGDLGIRRIGRQAGTCLDRAIAPLDDGSKRVVHVDLDRVAVPDAEWVAQRDGIAPGMTRREVHQL